MLKIIKLKSVNAGRHIVGLVFNPIIILIGILAAFVVSVAGLHNPGDLVNPTAGAFFGAAAAFLLNIIHEERKKKSQQTSELKKVNYIVTKIFQFNEILSQHINSNVSRNITGFVSEWEKIPRFLFTQKFPRINLESLMFLQGKDEKSAALLNVFYDLDEVNQELIICLSERNQRYATFLDITDNLNSLSQEDLRAKLGGTLFSELEQFTKHMRELNTAIKTLCINARKLLNELQ